jgi:hypothetical protein
MTITAPAVTDPNAAPYNVVADVNPEMAKQLLEYNTKNRKLLPAAVKEYARAMKDGRWLFDGAPIRISSSGVVLDGQHRLQAIVQSGTTQRMSIWKNIDPATQAVMDTGRKRTFSNALTLDGVPNPSAVASATSAYFFWTQGLRDSKLASFSVVNGMRPQISQLQEFFETNQDRILQAVNLANRVTRVLPVSRRVMAMLWLAFSEKDQDATDIFFEKLITGSDLAEGDPILALRNRLMIAHGEVGNLENTWQIGVFLKAWNHYRDGNTVKRIQYKLNSNETFPEPK